MSKFHGLGYILGKTIDYLPVELDKKLSLIFILTFTTIAVVDSTIIRFITYSGIEPTTSTSVSIFIVFLIAFAITCLFLVNIVEENHFKINSRYTIKSKVSSHCLFQWPNFDGSYHCIDNSSNNFFK